MRAFLMTFLAVGLFYCIGQFQESLQEEDQEPKTELMANHDQVQEVPAEAVAAAEGLSSYTFDVATILPAPDCQGITNHQKQTIPFIASRDASKYIDGTGNQITEGNMRRLKSALQQENYFP